MWLISVYLLALNSTAQQAAAVVAAAAVAGALSYLAASRSTSGDIRRTSPDKLWDVADSIRVAVTDLAETRRLEIERLNGRLTDAEAQIEELRAEVRRLRARLADD